MANPVQRCRTGPAPAHRQFTTNGSEEKREEAHSRSHRQGTQIAQAPQCVLCRMQRGLASRERQGNLSPRKNPYHHPAGGLCRMAHLQVSSGTNMQGGRKEAMLLLTVIQNIHLRPHRKHFVAKCFHIKMIRKQERGKKPASQLKVSLKNASSIHCRKQFSYLQTQNCYPQKKEWEREKKKNPQMAQSSQKQSLL